MGNDGECWSGAPFEPDLYVAILIVGSVHGIVGVNEDVLWIRTEGAVVGQGGAIEAPCGV